MRIYTFIKIDMSSGKVLEEKHFDHEGVIAECKGGGSSTTEAVDYGYNDRMARISEEQQSWARDYYQLWQQYHKPYEIAQAKANMEMLPYETALYKQQLQTANELLPQQKEAAEKFMSQALEGVDVNERMALASADTANAWKNVRAEAARDSARMGVNPNSGRFQGIMAALDTNKAAQLASARTQARVGAEKENFSRAATAAQMNLAGNVLQGVNFLGG